MKCFAENGLGAVNTAHLIQPDEGAPIVRLVHARRRSLSALFTLEKQLSSRSLGPNSLRLTPELFCLAARAKESGRVAEEGSGGRKMRLPDEPMRTFREPLRRDGREHARRPLAPWLIAPRCGRNRCLEQACTPGLEERERRLAVLHNMRLSNSPLTP